MKFPPQIKFRTVLLVLLFLLGIMLLGSFFRKWLVEGLTNQTNSSAENKIATWKYYVTIKAEGSQPPYSTITLQPKAMYTFTPTKASIDTLKNTLPKLGYNVIQTGQTIKLDMADKSKYAQYTDASLNSMLDTVDTFMKAIPTTPIENAFSRMNLNLTTFSIGGTIENFTLTPKSDLVLNENDWKVFDASMVAAASAAGYLRISDPAYSKGLSGKVNSYTLVLDSDSSKISNQTETNITKMLGEISTLLMNVKSSPTPAPTTAAPTTAAPTTAAPTSNKPTIAQMISNRSGKQIDATATVQSALEIATNIQMNLGTTISYSDPSYNITNLKLVFDAPTFEKNYEKMKTTTQESIQKTNPNGPNETILAYSQPFMSRNSSSLGVFGIYYTSTIDNPIATNEPGPNANITIQPSIISDVGQRYGTTLVCKIAKELPPKAASLSKEETIRIPVIYTINGTDTVYWFVYSADESIKVSAGLPKPYSPNVSTAISEIPAAQPPPPPPTLGTTFQYLRENGNF